MFEFMSSQSYYAFEPTEYVEYNESIIVSAEKIMQSAMDTTVRQFNEACETVCHEQS
jgi:hypothetical protein